MQNYQDLLEKIRPAGGSGVKEFDKAEFEKLKKNKNNEKPELLVDYSSEVFDICVEFFHSKSYSEILDYLYEDPSRISSNEIKALKFLAELKLGFKATSASLIKRDAFYEYNKDLKFAEILIEISQRLKITDIDFFKYTENLPQLNYPWIKALIYDPKQNLEKADFEEFLKRLDECQEKLENNYGKDQEIKTHFEERVCFLKILIYKNLANDNKTQEYLNQYFDLSFGQEEKISKLILISNELSFTADQLLSNLDKLYLETKEISSFIARNSLLTNDTCSSYACDDCCRYTSPPISLTEFEYIKNWASANNFDLSKAIVNAKQIHEAYEKEHGESFKIENKDDNTKLNPHDYKYDCPFLDQGRCSIHEARPLLCRVFGTGTTDSKFIKSCNFYLNQYQVMSSPEYERLVYDARVFQEMLDESDKYLSGGNQAKTGLIPAFLMDFEQNS